MKIWLIEGTDGTGKSTFSKELTQELPDACFLKFPSTMPTEIDKKSKANRIVFHLNDFKTQLDNVEDSCENLIVDRCFWSTLVYQGFNKGTTNPDWAFDTILQLGASLFHHAGDELCFVHLSCDLTEAVDRVLNRSNSTGDPLDSLQGVVLKDKIHLLSQRYQKTSSLTMDYFRKRYFYQPDLIQIDNTDLTVEEELRLVLP